VRDSDDLDDRVHPSGDGRGPYERVLRRLVATTADQWWPDDEHAMAVGVSPWLAARVADETDAELTASSGGNVVAELPDLTVIGCPPLDGPGAGTLVVQDLISGWSYDLPVCCHPDLAPHRWTHFALALAEGLNLNAALDLAQIPG
jgi:hypothetical protein